MKQPRTKKGTFGFNVDHEAFKKQVEGLWAQGADKYTIAAQCVLTFKCHPATAMRLTEKYLPQ